MQVLRLGNMDIHIILNSADFSELENLAKNTNQSTVATAQIQAPPYDPLTGKELSLIYDPDRDVDNGVDCTEMISHFKEPPIPVYIADRGVQRLKNREPCGSAYKFAKVEIRVQS